MRLRLDGDKNTITIIDALGQLHSSEPLGLKHWDIIYCLWNEPHGKLAQVDIVQAVYGTGKHWKDWSTALQKRCFEINSRLELIKSTYGERPYVNYDKQTKLYRLEPFESCSNEAKDFVNKYRPDLNNAVNATYEHCREIHLTSPQRARNFAGDIERLIALEGGNISALSHQLLQIMSMGFPVDPDHIRDFKILPVEQSISIPHYLTLLHTIRLCEIDYKLAEEKLSYGFTESLDKRWFKECPLAYYIIGLAVNKMGRRHSAKSYYHQGNKVATGPNACVDKMCKVGCNINAIQLELARAEGSVLRKLNRKKDSLQLFRGTAELAKNETIPISDRASYLFSWGYLEYQLAFEPGTPESFDHDLAQVAIGLLEDSLSVDPNWSAPSSRLGFLHKALENDKEAQDQLFLAITLSTLEGKKPEAILTRINAEFAYLLFWPNEAADEGIDCDAVLMRLSDLLNGPIVVPQSTRQCHANDNRIIRKIYSLAGSRDMPKDLESISSALENIANWDYLGKPQREWALEYFG